MKKMVCCVLALLCLGAVSDAQNLLKNPGFEDPLAPDNWTPAWGTFSREAWNTPPDGSQAAYIRGTWCGVGDGGGVIQSAPATAGADYDLSALFYVDNGFTAATRVLKLEFFDQDEQLVEAFTNALDDLADGKWTKKSVSAKAPAGSRRLQVVFEATGVGGEGTIGADNFVLEEKK